MPRFEEGALAFEFGERWEIFKLDEHSDYRERIGKIEGTKAVDFLGILDERELYLIEVKDFRQHRIETRDRLLTGELAIEIAQKVRDSLAGIIGAYRTSSVSSHWQPYARLLHDTRATIKVVVWLEYDLPPHPVPRKKALASVGTNVFKQKLKWLTSQVFVYNTHDARLPDLTVINLPRHK